MKVVSKLGLVCACTVVAFAVSVGNFHPPSVQAGPTAVLAVSPVICTALAISGGASQTDAALTCKQLHTVGGQLFVDRWLGDDDGVVEVADFQGWDLDANQIHEKDGMLWIVAFVDDDANVAFRAEAGGFADLQDQSRNLGREYICNRAGDSVTGADNDCDGDPATRGNGVVAGLLSLATPAEAKRGPLLVHVDQGRVRMSVEVSVVGEPDSIEFLTLETDMQVGAKDCPLPTTAAKVLADNALPEKSVILAIVRDSDGTAVSQAFVEWSPVFGESKAEQVGVAAPLTPTIDLGAFGIGAPNMACGGEKAGKGVVVAEILGSGFTLDPQAEVEEGKFTFNVRGAPGSLTVAADPPSLVCDGRASSRVTATVVDDASQPVVAGNEVRFDVRVLGTANPIRAKTGADGKASSTVTPLAGGHVGVPVVVTVGDLQASVLIECGAAPPAAPAASVPPTGEPVAGRAGGEVRPPTGAALPRAGNADAVVGDGGTMRVVLPAAAGLALVVLGWAAAGRRRIDLG